MNASITDHHQPNHRSRRFQAVFLISLGLLVFCALFLFIDQANFRFVSAHLPSVGTSFWLATTWGIVSRAPWILIVLILAFLKPRFLGLQVGSMRSRWRFVLSVIIVNCVVVGAFLLLSGSSTPYSGNQWLFTEIVIVPLVEELFWRGLVFSLLLLLLEKYLSRDLSLTLTVWLSGIAFGLMHAGNALAGVPLQFVAIQTLNAAIWGVVYGYARAKTDSVYPSILSHAAMNLVVVLF
jgi:membrane protease YdiL (CAAX protease family)